MNWTGIGIFAVTYALIAARRVGMLGLDRPAAALVGAVACVAFGVLTPDAAIHAVDGSTLLLLFGVMGMGAYLVLDGFFDVVQAWLAPLSDRPARLLGAVVWGAGGLSAFITNDAVCLLVAPLLVRIVQAARLPPVPYLLALATAANTGSAATLVGNPQNMLCGQLGGLAYGSFLLIAGPIALAGLAVNHAVLWIAFRAQLTARLSREPFTAPPSATTRPSMPAAHRPRLSRAHATTLAVIGASAVAYAWGAPLAWTAAGGFTLLMLARRRNTAELWKHIDWSLLLFFAGLFVVVEALRVSGATDWLFARYPLPDTAQGLRGRFELASLFVIGSNLVSNVPFILVVQEQLARLADPESAWTLLAIASTFAGNLTLLGSAANVIVAESARDVGSFGFAQHLRVGLPISVLTTALAVVWMWALS